MMPAGNSESSPGRLRELGIYRSDGSPLGDHDAARELIESAVEEIAARIETPTGSRRHGAQPMARRNIRAYLFRDVLALSWVEIARELGDVRRQTVTTAARRGASLVARYARSKADPRRPMPPAGPRIRNENQW